MIKSTFYFLSMLLIFLSSCGSQPENEDNNSSKEKNSVVKKSKAILLEANENAELNILLSDTYLNLNYYIYKPSDNIDIKTTLIKLEKAFKSNNKQFENSAIYIETYKDILEIAPDFESLSDPKIYFMVTIILEDELNPAYEKLENEIKTHLENLKMELEK